MEEDDAFDFSFDEYDFDNSGATVITDDGRVLTYDTYAEETGVDNSGYDNSGVVVIDGTDADADLAEAGDGEADPFADFADIEPTFSFIDPFENRRPVIGVDDMCRMSDVA